MRIMAAYQLFLYTVVGGVFGLIAILAIIHKQELLIF